MGVSGGIWYAQPFVDASWLAAAIGQRNAVGVHGISGYGDYGPLSVAAGNGLFELSAGMGSGNNS